MDQAPGQTLKELTDDYVRAVISRALAAHQGNRTKAARELGLKRTALLYRMKELGID